MTKSLNGIRNAGKIDRQQAERKQIKARHRYAERFSSGIHLAELHNRRRRPMQRIQIDGHHRRSPRNVHHGGDNNRRKPDAQMNRQHRQRNQSGTDAGTEDEAYGMNEFFHRILKKLLQFAQNDRNAERQTDAVARSVSLFFPQQVIRYEDGENRQHHATERQYLHEGIANSQIDKHRNETKNDLRDIFRQKRLQRLQQPYGNADSRSDNGKKSENFQKHTQCRMVR